MFMEVIFQFYFAYFISTKEFMMRSRTSFAVVAVLIALAAAMPARACGLSGMSSDCEADCSTVEAGWKHTACIIGAVPPPAETTQDR